MIKQDSFNQAGIVDNTSLPHNAQQETWHAQQSAKFCALKREVFAEAELAEQVTPYLLRLSTAERVAVNAPTFKIGKKVGYSDYIIQGNSAVSRIHADIIRRAGHFYIKDNNSTNGTFVWDVRIPAQEEIEIFDMDEIRFANERFEFHITGGDQ